MTDEILSDKLVTEREAVPRLAARQIQEMIANGTVKPGAKLPSQRELSIKLNISRSSLREALSILETKGLIQIDPGRSAVVCLAPNSEFSFAIDGLERSTPEEVFQARLLLETYATRLAAGLISTQQLQHLRQLNDEIRIALRAQDLDQAAHSDLALHRAIIKYGGNRIFDQIHETLQAPMLASHLLPLGAPGRLWEPILEHENILKALELRDPDSAAYYMRLHLIRTAGRAGIDEALCISW
ncbi:FadR family transcriptional regulator [Acidisoma cellulosilytica]|uniref:FadR family transcriptional regulator n=1 Tax=Acidisoma cellulosilyticum TaxID=2802395 RepID=A0A964E4J8_9PROT|nr:FCD domain-containing protein [Acidisoma cellulosilyticum]MCB8881342.1 FadR family transcriptional regulator [Acidisoma cellulosilyticum]